MSKRKPQTVERLAQENEVLRARLAALQDAEAGRRHAHQVLREQREKFRGLFDQSPIRIELYDAAGLLVDANAACLEMFGVPDLDAVRGFRLFDDPNLPDDVKQHLKDGKPHRCEIDFDFEKVKTLGLYPTSKSGTIRLDVLITPLREADGASVSGYLVQVQDLTDRKRAEAALRGKDREKTAILDSITELLLYQDTDHRILWVNQAAAESVGETPEALVGRHCHEVWHQRNSPCDNCPVASALKSGQPEVGHVTSPDGRSWSIRAYPVRDENGQIIGTVEATLDITERREAEESLRVYRSTSRPPRTSSPPWTAITSISSPTTRS